MNTAIYISILFLVIAFYLIMGLKVLWAPVDHDFLPIEQTRRRRIQRAVACNMFAWALGVFIYVPIVLTEGYDSSGIFPYQLAFMFNMAIQVPCVFWVMVALLQIRRSLGLWTLGLVVPEMAFIAWFFLAPDPIGTPTPLIAMSVWTVTVLTGMLCKYYADYRRFVNQLKSLYADLTCRDITWTWYAFGILTLQTLIYIVYQFHFSLLFETLFVVFSMATCLVFAHYTLHMRPISVAATITDEPAPTTPDTMAPRTKDQVIDELLRKHCEEAQLYLNPKLSRDFLCAELGINKNQLGRHFASQGSSFYDYINRLRIEHACRLIADHLNDDDIPMALIAERSGFANTVTFRSAFKTYKGCLPSAYARQLVTRAR